MTLMPLRFEDHRPMLLAGLRRAYAFHQAPTEIPAAWRTFAATLPLSGQVGDTTYGAVCGVDMEGGGFEYLCGVEVDRFDGLDPEIGRMKLPAARYAVFKHDGPITGVKDTFEAACHWLDGNGEWIDGHTPTFERYGSAFDPITGEGTEIWLPVVRA